MKKKLSVILCAMILAGSAALDGCDTAKTDIFANGNTANLNSSSSANGDTLNISDENISAKALSNGEKNLVRAGINGFSAKLFKEVYSQSGKKENLLLSPLSVYTGLSLLNNGADGDTYEEVTNALTAEGLPASTADIVDKPLDNDILNGYFSYYMNDLALSNNEFTKLKTANSFWAIKRDDTVIKDDFINAAGNFYLAEIWNVPFNKSVVTDINSWVKDNTDGMIDSILSEDGVTKDTAAILLNAVAFDAEWQSPYPSYSVHSSDFHNYDGTTSKVDLMSEELEGGSYFDDGYSLGFTKNYRAEEGSKPRYCFAAILPNEDVGIDEYIEKHFTADTFTENLNNLIYGRTVNTSIPKFDFDYGITLNDSLKAMGVESAFDKTSANFSRMADIVGDENQEKNLYLNKVLHKTHITVDEQGTRAAVVTAFEIDETDSIDLSEPVYITLNRPFIFAIYDYKEQVPVFIGTVNDL